MAGLHRVYTVAARNLFYTDMQFTSYARCVAAIGGAGPSALMVSQVDLYDIDAGVWTRQLNPPNPLGLGFADAVSLNEG